MKFTETAIAGAFLVDLEQWSDERGTLVRTFCAREFGAQGLPEAVLQGAAIQSPKRGTMRGLHYQLAPELEPKFVRCTRGAIHEVVIDVRPESPTYLQHVAVTLRAGEPRALFIPAHCAHGYLTLEDDTETSHLLGGFHTPELTRGIRHDDPFFRIAWPVAVAVIAPRDESWPDFEPAR